VAGESHSGQLGWGPAGLAPGMLLAGYRVESRIGAGGMAMVLRARDEALGRTVALKVLVPALAGDGEFRERFVRESRAVAAVDHPHIIPVYAAGEADGMLYLAMRYVAGGDLRRVVQREGRLSGGRAVTLLSPIASALDAAHAAGLVHRDVKPANILIDRSPGRPEHPYLSDFGLAKGAAASSGLTGTGQFLGTPDYSAPEQISGRPARPQTDQYALACVAYSILTGALPFARDEPMAVLWAHMYDQPPSLTADRPDLPAAADRVLARALAKEPDERYATCGEFASALREAIAPASPGSSRPGTGASGAAASAAAGRSRTPDWSGAPSAPRTADVPPHPSFPPAADQSALRRPRSSQSLPPTVLPPAAAGPGLRQPSGSDGYRAAASHASDTVTRGPDRALAAPTLPPLNPPAGRTVRHRHGQGQRGWRPGPRAGLAAGAAVLLTAGVAAAVVAFSPDQPSAAAGRSPAGPATAKSAATPPAAGAVGTASAHGSGGQLVAALPNPAGDDVMMIAFGSGGTLDTIAASGSTGKGGGYSFDIATKTMKRSVPMPEQLIYGSGITPDGKLLVEATGCGGGCGGSVLDAASGRQVVSLPDAAAFNGYSISDTSLVTADADNNGMSVYSLASGARLATLTNPDDHFQTGSAVSANGKVVVVNSDNGGATHHVYVWSVASQALLLTLTIPATDGEVINPEQLSSDGATLAVGIGPITRLYDVATGRLIRTLPATLGALSPDGSLVAAPGAKGIQVWDVATGKVAATLEPTGKKATAPNDSQTALSVPGFAIAFSANGKSVAAGFGSTTDVWNLPAA
jgi:serine/threonine protein kinase/WD40 repeat protein